MPRFKITISARVIDHASRSFLVVVDDGNELRHLDSQMVSDWADEARIPWEVTSIGYLEVDEHEVKEIAEDDRSVLPVVNLRSLP
jgi:hypothetical protein